jgi:predicted GNAT family acetyltransferase
MIADHPERHRYELEIDGRKAAEIVYRMHGPDTIDLVHTEVKPEFEGQGLASKIATFALDDARKRGLKVIPSCVYIQGFLRKHPEYADLVSSVSPRT